ncbi:MAG: hypothetical protein IJS66_01115 [Bacteroidales bacterium]|nr:hypothetical protein [Bacteroidales bacterium]
MKTVFLMLYMLYALAPAAFASVRPEDFGAKGDGLADDSPAFNACIASGAPIYLSKGKIYRLITAIDPIRTESFELKGNGARIVIDDTYPLERYALVFRFDSDGRRRSSFTAEDFDAVYLPGPKFDNPDEVGDTYFIFLDNCSEAVLRGIRFSTPSIRNNLTFFASYGVGRLEMSGCDISINTLSRQGGALWIMNKYFKTSEIVLRNCSFEHDTRDECICFSAAAFEGLKDCSIRAKVTGCSIVSDCNSPSSGFMMAAHNFPGKAAISLEFRRCRFKARGPNSRKILSFQSGLGPEGTYASVDSKFLNCSFDYDFSSESDTGLLSLPHLCGPFEDEFVYNFVRCRFRMRGVHPLIGDRDGDKAGSYLFRNCRVDAPGPVFDKYYNVSSSRINLDVKGGRTYYKQ